jgi:hypothetical protein
MKMTDLKKRLRKDRPMATISLRMPEDVVDDLKRLAPVLGFSGYQPLARHYIGLGMRKDMTRLEDTALESVVASLKRRGVSERMIAEAIAEAKSAGR